MSLTFEQRAAAVKRLSAAASASPRRYRFRVIAWICFGYALVAAVFVLALAPAVLIALTGTWGLFLYAWIPTLSGVMIGRALFVRIDPPAGRELRRHEAPQLFAILDLIRKRLNVPHLNGVLISTEMNAEVVETPRFGGLFGWQRHLVIGLPFLITHSAEEMKAVLAHELGHLSAQHGRINAWSWRVRVTWSSVLTSLDRRRGYFAYQLQKLMHWYVERLMLVTIVLVRNHELAADEASASLTSKETAARSLAWHTVAAQLLERRYWTPLWERVPTDPQPPTHPLHELLQRRMELLAPPYDDVLAAELARNTAIDDTHPALRARLLHLGVRNPQVGPAPRCAADELLGRTAAAVLTEADRLWRTMITPQWRERHEALKDVRKQVDDAAPLDAAAADAAALHQKADALVELGRDADALPIFEALLARDASDARAAFHVGRILVQRGDLAGVHHLQKAMTLDWQLAAPSCELAYSALREKGLEKDAHAWAERYQREMQILDTAQQQAATLAASDDLAPTQLSEAAQNAILAACRAATWVGKVWIARKNLRAVQASVDVVVVTGKTFRFAGQKVVQALANEIRTDEPVMVFLTSDGTLMRRLDRLGARRQLR